MISETTDNEAEYLDLPVNAAGGYTVMTIRPVVECGPERPANEALAILEILADEYIAQVFGEETFRLAIRDNLVLIIPFPTPPDYAKTLELAAILIERINPRYPGKITIGIGDAVSNLESLPAAYRQSLRAAEEDFFIGSGQAIHVRDIEPHSGDVANLDYVIPDEILEAIRLGKPGEVRLRTKYLFEKLRDTAPRRIEIVQALCLELVIGVNRMLSGSRIFDNPGERPNISWDTLLQLTSFKEMQEWLRDRLAVTAEFVRAKRSARSLLIVERMKREVEEHLSDELSTQSLGNKFKLTPNYVGMLFKKETGKTFLEFLTGRRIEKAKELLRDPSVKLYEIADAVGYADPDYFTRVFKKHLGRGPSQYRGDVLT